MVLFVLGGPSWWICCACPRPGCRCRYGRRNPLGQRLNCEWRVPFELMMLQCFFSDVSNTLKWVESVVCSLIFIFLNYNITLYKLDDLAARCSTGPMSSASSAALQGFKHRITESIWEAQWRDLVAGNRAKCLLLRACTTIPLDGNLFLRIFLLPLWSATDN